MRIGILTFHFSDNFGALLQAYALRKWFIDRGHTAEFILYHPTHVEEGGSMRLSINPSAMKANIKNLYLMSTAFLHKHFGNKHQARKFAEFRTNYLGISGNSLRTIGDLEAIASRYDLIVAGSDQVWSPSVQYGFDPAYFLVFSGNANARRISYAASFGKDKISSSELMTLTSLLQTLQGISVREASGVDIVKEASGRDAACVPDPTLLHTGYDELLGAAEDGHSGHVFCYALRTAETIRVVAETAAQALSAPIISPYNMHRRWREIGQTVHPGPAEWISQLARARFVVTNSFHGTVFSILFRKSFLVIELPGVRTAMNARSLNLLEQLGLLNRFIDKRSTAQAMDLINTPIDWNSVAVKQDALRSLGISFLEKELAQVTRD